MPKCNCNTNEYWDPSLGLLVKREYPKQKTWTFCAIVKALWDDDKWVIPEGLAFNRQEFRSDKLWVVVYNSNYWTPDTDLAYRAGCFAKLVLDLLHWRLWRKIKARAPKPEPCKIRITLPRRACHGY